MKLFIGLGNPGSRYTTTPHNLGFVAAEALAHAWRAEPFRASRQSNAVGTRARLGHDTIIIIKPQTMMNASGEAVRPMTKYHRISASECWVLHDDVDLPPGEIRHSFASRSAGHRGVQSIIDALGTNEFHRIRIGIGKPDRMRTEAFVLRPMTATLRRATERAMTTLPSMCTTLLAQAKHQYALEQSSRHHQSARRAVAK
jgi:PTH1 family peptidyl-tRNA hydrolase